jgi:hypothetical protein
MLTLAFSINLSFVRDRFIQKLGDSRATLKTYGSVYNSVKPLLRHNDLSFERQQF